MTLIRFGSSLLRFGDLLAASQDCCCDVEGVCLVPTEWRIIDENDRIYGKGPIVIIEGAPLILDYPEDVPAFYWEVGPRTYRLEVLGCGDGWVQLNDPTDSPIEWYHDLEVCENRYNGGLFSAEEKAGGIPMPPPCDCKVDPETQEPTDPCDPCPDLAFGEIGTGQAWREPPPAHGYTFTGDIDWEWTNLLNWQDADGRSPAIRVPDENEDCVIAGNVTSAFGGSVSVRDMTIEGEFHVAASVANLYCSGLVGRDGACEDVFGDVTVEGVCEFTGTSSLEGEVTCPTAEFSNSSQINALGVLRGDAEFANTALNAGGVVTGDATFNDEALNGGDIQGNAEFNDESRNDEGLVQGAADFNDNAQNDGAVDGFATFNQSSANGPFDAGAGIAGRGYARGGAQFNDDSVNDGLVNGVVSGEAIFNDNSVNNFSVDGDAIFNSAVNNGQVDNATFTDDAVHAGTVVGDALFTDTSRFESGSVGGTATFTDSSCYVAGTAGTFDPDPPPSC